MTTTLSLLNRSRGEAPLIACLVLALAPAACTRSQSLGAVGDHDGGVDLGSTDDRDSSADTGPEQCPVTQPVVGSDCTGSFSCSYDYVTCCGFTEPNWSCSCQLGHVACRWNQACEPPLADCQVDAGTDAPGDASSPDARTAVATITVSRSTNSPEIDVVVYSDGSAERTIIGPDGGAGGSPRTFDPGSPEGTMFLSDLGAAGDISTIPVSPDCPKSVSFGTVTTVTAGGKTSVDMQCLLSPSAVHAALAHDCEVLTGTDSSTFSQMAHECLAMGGQVGSSLCCTSAGDFPDSCAVGACGCSPSNSHSVNTCLCPGGGCFSPSLGGCAGPSGICTVGADQSCNDNPALNSIHGQCVTGGRCMCGGFGLAASGKCL
jgi:hypothetical protein